MYRKLIAASLIMIMAVGFVPIIAEAVDEVPWAHILDDDFEMMVKPMKKPPVVDPPAQPDEFLPWGVDRIDAELVGYDGTGINVAILDTGIDKDHPDLAGNIVESGCRNFVQTGRKLDTSKWDDDNGHGTHVAGTIGAIDNDIGVIGVAPNVNLFAYKVLDRSGSGSIYWIADAIRYAADHDIDIISMSLGAASDYQGVLESACSYAYGKGVLIVAAAGNEAGAVSYPAALSTVIAVSATGHYYDDEGLEVDYFASFSNYGSEVELSAPGVSVESTYKDGTYAIASGTSMATPHVAGVAALVLEKTETLTPAQVRSALCNSAEDLGDANWDQYFGYGLVDAQKATA